jgi:hypothetical protein
MGIRFYATVTMAVATSISAWVINFER